MIRRLLVWLIVLVTALAAGIALGGGPLSDAGRTPSQAAPAAPSATEPATEAQADFADAFAGRLAPRLYARGLEGQSVAVLTLPGADPETVEQMGAEVSAARGELTGTFALERALVDGNEKTLVDTFGAQVVEQLGADLVPPGATTYDRIGRLIGRAVSARSDKEALAEGKLASLRASLVGAGFVEPPDGEPALATLVLVVTGHEVEQPVLSGLVAGLAAATTGLVVAGPTSDASVAALRAQQPSLPVATVDGTDTAAGRVTTTLALVHSLREPGGSYGASGSDGPVPLG